MATNETSNAIIKGLLYTAGTPGTRLDPYHVVKISAAWTADICTGGSGAPNIPYGIVQPKDDDILDTKLIKAGTYVSGSYADGEHISVCRAGECMAMVGTAGVTAGLFVMADASGHVVDHKPGGYVLGQAMETATTGNPARILVEPMATAGTATRETQVASANGAITIAAGDVIITKGGVCALTLADPVAGDNYDIIRITSNTANAHTVTADWNGLGSAAYTFPAEAGASIEVMAYGGKWLLPTTIKCASFVGALTGNATTATTATTANSVASASVFVSAEITGNGSSQSTAHGLVTLPALVFAIPSDLSGGACTIVPGTHTTTNALFTVTNGEKYKVVCIK